jgi:hypothetical protein
VSWRIKERRLGGLKWEAKLSSVKKVSHMQEIKNERERKLHQKCFMRAGIQA